MPSVKRSSVITLSALLLIALQTNGAAIAGSRGGPKKPRAQYSLMEMLDPNFEEIKKSRANAGTGGARRKHTVPTGPGRPALTARLEVVRKNVIAHKNVPYADLQALADAGDSLGAYSLAKAIMAKGDPALMTHALHYFAFAAMYDRKYAVSPMVQILVRRDIELEPAHLQQAEKALLRQASTGSDKALDSLVRFYRLGEPFSAKPEQATQLLEARAGKSDGAAAYQLAVLLLSGGGEKDGETRQEAIRYLTIAKDEGSIGVRAAAFNLIETLSEDEPDDDQDNKV